MGLAQMASASTIKWRRNRLGLGSDKLAVSYAHCGFLKSLGTSPLSANSILYRHILPSVGLVGVYQNRLRTLPHANLAPASYNISQSLPAQQASSESVKHRSQCLHAPSVTGEHNTETTH